MKQLSFDERNLMLGVFRGKGQLEMIASKCTVSVGTVRGVLNGKTAHSEQLLKTLRERLEMARLAAEHLELARTNARELQTLELSFA